MIKRYVSKIVLVLISVVLLSSCGSSSLEGVSANADPVVPSTDTAVPDTNADTAVPDTTADTVAPDTTTPAPTGSIIGVIKSASTSAGISAVTIDLLDSAGSVIGTTTSDANGGYSLPNIGDGTYTLVFSKGGYIECSYQGIVVVEGGEVISGALLFIVSSVDSGNVEGDLTDALTGSFLASVTIDVREGWGNSTGTVVASTSTDSLGHYSITALPAGNYSATLSHPGFISVTVNIIVVGSVTTPNQNASISPDIPVGEIRIV